MDDTKVIVEVFGSESHAVRLSDLDDAGLGALANSGDGNARAMLRNRVFRRRAAS